ncbi:Zinc finger SWIM domain protein OS=Tsukamurella paurometabola (strain ATCC 8368 / DSM / CCUG 35730 / CIP 100753 / JCM 10117 / KCTC 9821 / NBRC 16120 / NCIMB 702349 / NCTC 13040) OX=521096 GN=Tpau_1216 PE=4 SV=1 [Tsukamurella paurometabola]|uniref:Zinc finger SWIM domain protein n=2 Tax=Tsukamurella paurometabola TaxID=2061 RepID=D5UW40_TSUPD|nr:zinc finger SWIM domain-containing protein [Tsukamurella paurometabola]ADG77847.1 zinc finger SWIM domain protein [Tsukamurella paurometabola DSM 20162]
MARRARDTARPMGGTWFTRRLIAQREEITERRKVQYARRLYQEHQVFSLAVVPASVTATVQGSQLDPFGVSLARIPGDPAAVISLLLAQGATAELLAVTRGELGRTLGELVLPETASDVEVSCACPDESGACVHALALTYEYSAAADLDPSLILDFAGVPLAGLLARVAASGRESPVRSDGAPCAPPHTPTEPSAVEEWDAGAAAFYGDGMDLPALPEPSPVDPMTLLDPALLRSALRRTGTKAGDVAEAQDELAELYDRLRSPR